MEQERRASDRLILEMQQDLKALLRNQAEIKSQVQMTNGRVGKLEMWRSFVLGSVAVIGMLIVPMFMAWFGTLLK